MTFYRIKKIKGIEYIYLVKNKWTKKGARQKVSKYLGKLIRLEKKNHLTNQINEITPDFLDKIIEQTLIEHGFKKKDDKTMIKENIIYKNKKISKEKKPVVLYLNEGYFCNNSIKELYNFNYLGSAKQTATELAKAFVDAGIVIPQELFVSLFQKVYDVEKTTRLSLLKDFK